MILLSFIVGCLLFIILFLISFGTYWFLRRAHERSSRIQQRSTALSLSNCFASGVFLSTCFLGLLPHIREHEMRIHQIREQHITSPHSRHILSSDLMVLVGFLVMLTVEECVRSCHSGTTREHKERSLNSANERADQKGATSSGGNAQGDTSLISAEEGVQLLLSDESSDEVIPAPKIEFRRTLEERNAHEGHAHHSVLPSEISLATVALLLGLSMHSIFEGIALGLQVDTTQFFHLLFGILLHELLCSFAFGVSLAQQETPRRTAFLTALILSASIPFGMTSSILVNSLSTYNALLFRFVLESLAAGAFIYVACIEMLSHELMHVGSHRSCFHTIAVTSGVVVFLIISSFFGHGDEPVRHHEKATTKSAGS